MSDGDFGGGFDSGGFDGGVDFSPDPAPDFSPPDSYSDYGPPLEGPGGTIEPPQQMLYVDGTQGPPQAPGFDGRNSSGFVATGGSVGNSPADSSSFAASNFLIPAMMMGTMSNPQQNVASIGMNPAARRQPIGCAAIFFMAFFVVVALAMAGVAFRNGMGILGVIPLGMALFAVIAIATGSLQNSAQPPARPASFPGNRFQPDQGSIPTRFCTYCGRLAAANEPGCAGCGGPIDGKPRAIR